MQLMYYVKKSTIMKDNIDRLLEALDHNEYYSDEDIYELLKDPDVRDFYDNMSKTSSLMSDSSAIDIDVDEQWSKFISTHHAPKCRRRFSFFSRKIAVASVVLIITTIAIVAGTIAVKYSGVFSARPRNTHSDSRQVIESHNETAVLKDSLAQVRVQIPEIKVFKDESFKQIILDVCAYYDASAEFKSQTTQDLRLYFNWDTSQSLDDVVDQLNSFDMIEISVSENHLIIK